MASLSSKEFDAFVKRVRVDFEKNRSWLLKKAQDAAPDARVYDVRLGGSYAKGRPREDSDVDLEVWYDGDVDASVLAQALYGELAGAGGVYDIVPVSKVREAAGRRSSLTTGVSTYVLYHATLLDRVESILEKGLVPGFAEPPGQDWKGKYSGKGIYFHQTFPQHELDSSVFDGDVTVAVLEVHWAGSPELVVPDEEVTEDPADFAAEIENGCPVVVLDTVPPEDVVAVHLPDVDSAEDWSDSADLRGLDAVFHRVNESRCKPTARPEVGAPVAMMTDGRSGRPFTVTWVSDDGKKCRVRADVPLSAAGSGEVLAFQEAAGPESFMLVLGQDGEWRRKSAKDGGGETFRIGVAGPRS